MGFWEIYFWLFHILDDYGHFGLAVNVFYRNKLGYQLTVFYKLRCMFFFPKFKTLHSSLNVCALKFALCVNIDYWKLIPLGLDQPSTLGLYYFTII